MFQFFFFLILLVNNYEIAGRHIKVDKADKADHNPAGSSYANEPSRRSVSAEKVLRESGHTERAVPTAPTTTSTSATSTTSTKPTVDQINETLNGMSNSVLLQVIIQMKTLASSNPEQARMFLEGNPSLSYALFQSLLNMGLVDPNLVQQVMSAAKLSKKNPPPPPPPSILSSGTPSTNTPEQQQALINQIMSLTPEQISNLPSQQRDQVLQLRAQMSMKH